MSDFAFQELIGEFLLEARERVGEVEALLLGLPAAVMDARRAAVAQVKRELHTLKGNSGMMGFSGLQRQAHGLEDQIQALDLEHPEIDGLLTALDQLRSDLLSISPQTEPQTASPTAADSGQGPRAEPSAPDKEKDEDSRQGFREGSVRVPFSRIDQLVEMLAETVIFRNRLRDAISRGLFNARRGQGDLAALLAIHNASWDDVEGAFQTLEKTLNQLQEQVTELGMVPLQSLFRSLGRIVHDESMRIGKKIELVVAGGETPIDKTLLEAAGTTLGHLVRNAVIHGIETPAARLKARKSETGTIRVSAALEANEVCIQVQDDGAGIDRQALRARAEQAGIAISGTEADFTLLFEEGFSTRRDTDLSAGRGVGLSAVRKTAERHNGRIEVRSQPGQGCSFALRLPVTASIARSLLVQADHEEYAVPLTAVVETLTLAPTQLHEVNHVDVVKWRKQLVPVLDLGLTFGTTSKRRRQGYAIILRVNQRLRALAVDEIVGIHDIVVKGLDRIVGQPAGVAGSTILGDGRVIMILDPATLATLALDGIGSDRTGSDRTGRAGRDPSRDRTGQDRPGQDRGARHER